MKRVWAYILALALLLSLCACGANAGTATEASYSKPTSEDFTAAAEDADAAEEEAAEEAPEPPAVEEEERETSMDGVSYVMIYNPFIYDERADDGSYATSRYTGDFSGQVITGMGRAGGLPGEELDLPVMVSQAEINAGLDTSEFETGGRAAGMDPSYEKGDTHDFYVDKLLIGLRVQETFECVYVGESCYIWALDGSISAEDAQSLAEEFDTVVYPMDTGLFGPARFTDNGGKVNILFYSLPEGVGGFFSLYDIFATGEASDFMVELYGLNTDHAIININSDMLAEEMDYVKSTLAHEFQHLICASDSLYYAESPIMRTWLNEAMSAYAEEYVYPGIKEAGCYNEMFYLSDNFRRGQSAYNFENANDAFIGAYGLVYLFSRYMSQESGEDIFQNVHEYWRSAYSATVTEAETLSNSVTDEFRAEIEDSISYVPSISTAFDSEYDEWMSKLILSFYIETLSMDLANLEEYEDVVHTLMLYGEINPVDIEGGGRIIVAVDDGSYAIPEDADDGLIYVGLDDDFSVVNILQG